MNSISAGARLYAQQTPLRFKRLGSQRDTTHRVPEIVRIPADELLNVIALTLTVGCGVLLSPTSDGGAVSIILYDGDERYRSYVTTAAELEQVLRDMTDHLEAKLAGPPTKGPKRAQ